MIRILIIEDDEDFSDILKECLEEDSDIKVVQVISTEQEARDAIRDGILKDVDCVLTDLQMPAMRGDRRVETRAGLRLIEEMRTHQRYYGTIIVLTNSRELADGQRALAAGCDGYLCKYAPLSDVPSMITELKMALRGNVVVVSREMRHVFFRDDISAKEARLMDLLCAGQGWGEIAQELGYKTAKAAANVGDRIFDKLLTMEDKQEVEAAGSKKRLKAVEIWKNREHAKSS